MSIMGFIFYDEKVDKFLLFIEDGGGNVLDIYEFEDLRFRGDERHLVKFLVKFLDVEEGKVKLLLKEGGDRIEGKSE